MSATTAAGIDVVIPAHRAHGTLSRTLCSITEQTIASELRVTVIDDACPEGDYHDVVAPFSSVLDIRLIRLPRNLGPGGTRQAGIDTTCNPYFTCIDSDDAFASPTSLRQLRDTMEQDDSIQRCGGLLEVFDSSQPPTSRKDAGVSMDGKLFRRSFVERYHLRFNGSRANEDFGYNLAVDLLCDNDAEKTYDMEDVVAHVYKNPGSITSFNDGQFRWDQRLCGLIDNSIWAFDLVKRHRPQSRMLHAQILRVLLMSYAYWCTIEASAPQYADQAWEYVKKYYHTCYLPNRIPAFENMERTIRPEATRNIFKTFDKHAFCDLPEGCEPPLTFDGFFELLRREAYDPAHIYDVWEEMASSPEMRERMAANEEIGVCERGYAQRSMAGDA